ncbi:hypothetical protein Tco_0651178 [Tanacetum coccineum]
MEPEDSLIMGDEDLRTIPEKESNEVIKSSVKDLVPIPSESEDTSDNDSECDLPFCDDSFPLDDIESEDSYVSKLDEPALLVIPLSDTNKDESSTQETILIRLKLVLQDCLDYEDSHARGFVPEFNTIFNP